MVDDEEPPAPRRPPRPEPPPPRDEGSAGERPVRPAPPPAPPASVPAAPPPPPAAPAGSPGLEAEPGAEESPSYTLYRARPQLRRPREGSPAEPAEPGGPPRRRRRPITLGRGLRWLAAGVGIWLLLSVVVFVLSAQTGPGVSAQAKASLDASGWPLFAPNTILVLGSDQRTSGTREPGASRSGPSRSDVMLLIRAGGGKAARLSIPRDTIVDIPGHGRAKINAAYAYGGPALAIRTVKRYLGIEINHLVEVNFENFPALIDALGGVDYTGGCVVSLINGGFRNGGYTLRLKGGTTRLNGKQALALARTRHNACNPGESDLVRARRQQKIFAAMEHRLLSPTALVHLPWVSWQAPRAIRSDMGAPTLLGLFGALATGGTPATRVLKPDGTATLPDGGVGLVVSAAERRAETQRFLSG